MSCSALPADSQFVRLRPGRASALALEVINESDVYGVLSETKTCYRLFDLQQYLATQQMRRIGSGVGGYVQFRRDWFQPASCPDDVQGFEATMPQREKYKLRKAKLPAEVLVWDVHGGVDRFTGRLKEEYESCKTAVHRDHVIEVQMLDVVMDLAFPWTGSLSPEGIDVSKQVLFPFLNGVGEFGPEMLNLNVTEDVLNQYWKGGTVRTWKKQFHETRGDVSLMRQRLGGDASLAGLLRAKMHVDSEGAPTAALKSAAWKGKGAQIQARYRPAWARAVDSTMGGTGRRLIERLREHDGESPFLRVADGLEDMLTKMELRGFAKA